MNGPGGANVYKVLWTVGRVCDPSERKGRVTDPSYERVRFSDRLSSPLGGRSHGEAFVGGCRRRCFGTGFAPRLFGREAGFRPASRRRSSGTVPSAERNR